MLALDRMTPRRRVIAAIALTGTLLGGVTLSYNDPVAAEQTKLELIQGLTGEAVGERLGLEPITPPSGLHESTECTGGWFTEFKEGTGFCLGGVTSDPVEENMIALQIMGYPATESALAFAELLAQERGSSDLTNEEQWALSRKMMDYRAQMDKERVEPPS